MTGEYRAKDCYPWLERAYTEGRLPLSESQLSHVHGWKYCIPHCAGLIRWPDGPDLARAFDWHLDDSGVLCKYGSGLNCMMQQAFLEGYNPIVLLGCDLGFRGRPRNCAFDPDHFDPQYNLNFASEERAKIDNETHIDFHTHAKIWCDAHGVQILNATRGGMLEVHPRVRLEDIV